MLYAIVVHCNGLSSYLVHLTHLVSLLKCLPESEGDTVAAIYLGCVLVRSCSLRDVRLKVAVEDLTLNRPRPNHNKKSHGSAFIRPELCENVWQDCPQLFCVGIATHIIIIYGL